MLDEIDYVLLTHLHGDHAGGLHPLILRKYFTSGERAKVLYATPNFRDELVRAAEAQGIWRQSNKR